MIRTYDPSLPRNQRRLEVTLPDELPDQAVITIHGLLYEILWAFERHYGHQINTHYAFGCVPDDPDDPF
jgi:hypothetical protein